MSPAPSPACPADGGGVSCTAAVPSERPGTTIPKPRSPHYPLEKKSFPWQPPALFARHWKCFIWSWFYLLLWLIFIVSGVGLCSTPDRNTSLKDHVEFTRLQMKMCIRREAFHPSSCTHSLVQTGIVKKTIAPRPDLSMAQVWKYPKCKTRILGWRSM